MAGEARPQRPPGHRISKPRAHAPLPPPSCASTNANRSPMGGQPTETAMEHARKSVHTGGNEPNTGTSTEMDLLLFSGRAKDNPHPREGVGRWEFVQLPPQISTKPLRASSNADRPHASTTTRSQGPSAAASGASGGTDVQGDPPSPRARASSRAKYMMYRRWTKARTSRRQQSLCAAGGRATLGRPQPRQRARRTEGPGEGRRRPARAVSQGVPLRLAVAPAVRARRVVPKIAGLPPGGHPPRAAPAGGPLAGRPASVRASAPPTPCPPPALQRCGACGLQPLQDVEADVMRCRRASQLSDRSGSYWDRPHGPSHRTRLGRGCLMLPGDVDEHSMAPRRRNSVCGPWSPPPKKKQTWAAKGLVWARQFVPAAPAFARPSLPSQFHSCVPGNRSPHRSIGLLPVLPGLWLLGVVGFLAVWPGNDAQNPILGAGGSKGTPPLQTQRFISPGHFSTHTNERAKAPTEQCNT